MSSKTVPHPYYPRDMKLPLYVPNDKSYAEILALFFSAVTVWTIILWVIGGRSTHTSSFGSRSKLIWFGTCGAIHMILESYFVVNFKTFMGAQNILAQIWKEYSNGDSRYVEGDTCIVSVEGITSFMVGPLCMLTVYAFINNKSYRYVLELLISVCQLYGTIVYFATEFLGGFTHGPLWHPLYFWFYFVVMNGFWIVIPLVCIFNSSYWLMSAQSHSDSKANPQKIKKTR